MKSKGIDLGVRPAAHAGQPIPSFRRQFRYVNSATTSSSAILFKPNAACAVLWTLVQTSAAVTLQLTLNGQPFGAALAVTSTAIIQYPGTLLMNNEVLGITVSGLTTLSFEVVWNLELDSDLSPETLIISGSAVSVAGTINENLIQQAGVTLSSPIADAPLGSEVAPVVRAITRKKTTIETITPLLANAVFTGAWHDSELDGTCYVVMSVYNDQAGVSSIIQESEDSTDAHFTRQVTAVSTTAANVLVHFSGAIKSRFWRIVYTNGTTNQTILKITTSALSIQPLPNSNDLASGLPAQPLLMISNSLSGSLGLDTSSAQTLASADGANNFYPLLTGGYLFGGAFSGTSDIARYRWNRARTPTVFKQITTAATGSTALWTPGSGNKFRLLKYRVVVNASAIMAAATDLTIKLFDSAADIGHDFIVRIPVAALTSGINYDSGLVDLGAFGILSAASNNVLNVNLSAALTGGLVSVMAAGTEE